MIRFYSWSLGLVLKGKFLTLLVTLATIAVSGYFYVHIPKGFFPIEDTGLIFATTEGAQDISFESMLAHQREAAAIVKANPNVQDVNSFVGATGFSPALNNGRMFIRRKPRSERKRLTRSPR